MIESFYSNSTEISGVWLIVALGLGVLVSLLLTRKNKVVKDTGINVPLI